MLGLRLRLLGREEVRVGVEVVKVLKEVNGNRSFIGTAFFINNKTLVTARHVIEEAYNGNYNIYLRDTPIKGDVPVSKESITLCKKRDVAIFVMKKEFDIQAIEISFDLLKVDSEVNIEGYYDLYEGIKKYRHYVSASSNAQYTYELQGQLTHGLSGSPVCIDNKIVGITQAISIDKNITYIIPISECCCEAEFEKLEKEKLKKEKLIKRKPILKYILYLVIFLIIMRIPYLYVSEEYRLKILEKNFNDIRISWEKSEEEPSLRKETIENSELLVSSFNNIHEEHLLFWDSKISKQINIAYTHIIISDLSSNVAKKIKNAEISIKLLDNALLVIKELNPTNESYEAERLVKYCLTMAYLYQYQLDEGKVSLLENAKKSFKDIKIWYSDKEYPNRKIKIIEIYQTKLR